MATTRRFTTPSTGRGSSSSSTPRSHIPHSIYNSVSWPCTWTLPPRRCAESLRNKQTSAEKKPTSPKLLLVLFLSVLLWLNVPMLPWGAAKAGWLGKPKCVAAGDSPASQIMVRSDVEIPRIELLCFLELDSQKWWCTEFRGNFYKVIFFPPSYFLGVRSEGSRRCSRSCTGPAFGASLCVCFLLMLIYLISLKNKSCWEAEVCVCVLAALKFLRTGSCAGCVPGLRGLCADLSSHHLRFFSTLATSTLIYF